MYHSFHSQEIDMEKNLLKTNRLGGIVRWQSATGCDIFYPVTTTAEGMERGGAFLAAPVLGNVPDTEAWTGVKLPTHGFFRKLPPGYPVISDHDQHEPYQTFDIDLHASEDYPWSFSVYTKVHSDNLSEMSYWVTIKRSEVCRNKRPMPLSGGLHPYFATDGAGWRLYLDGRCIADSTQSYALSKSFALRRGQDLVLQTVVGTAKLRLTGFNQVMVWSDQPTHYICVAPVFGRLEDVLLAPGHIKTCSCLIDFTPMK
jgi:galactose mutarotase-like enzyme